jgi:hypothetical protein
MSGRREFVLVSHCRATIAGARTAIGLAVGDNHHGALRAGCLGGLKHPVRGYDDALHLKTVSGEDVVALMFLSVDLVRSGRRRTTSVLQARNAPRANSARISLGSRW